MPDAYTSALLHMNGPDGSFTFTDESGKTWTARGDAQIDTAQSVFGGASGLFDGTGDSIDTPDHADFAFGSGDFTIDFRVRYGTVGIGSLYGQHVDNSNYINLYRSTGTLSLRFIAVSGGVTQVDIENSWTPSTNTWYHVALVRSGNDFLMFIDGVQIGTTQSDTSAIPDLAAVVEIGNSPETARLIGHLDEYRISKGIARWTANFTPPAAPYGIGYTQSVSGGITPSGAIGRSIGKIMSGTGNLSGALNRATAKAFAGMLAPAGALSKGTLKSVFTGILAPVGSLTKNTSKILGGVITPIGSLLRDVMRTIRIRFASAPQSDILAGSAPEGKTRTAAAPESDASVQE